MERSLPPNFCAGDQCPYDDTQNYNNTQLPPTTTPTNPPITGTHLPNSTLLAAPFEAAAAAAPPADADDPAPLALPDPVGDAAIAESAVGVNTPPEGT